MEQHKSLINKFSIAIVIALVVGLGAAIMLLQQRQDERSRADTSAVQACTQKAATDTIILLDVSQSMSITDAGSTGSRLANAKTAAAQFTDIIAQDTRNALGFVKFPNGSTTPGVPGTIAQILTSDFSLVKNKITELKIASTAAAEGTCLECGVVKVDEELAAHGRTGYKKVVVLLTDGEITAYVGAPYQNNNIHIEIAGQKALDAIAKDYAAHKTVYYTIGLGSTINGPYLQEIADLTGGKYYHAPTGAQLNNIYEEISQLLSTGSIGGTVFNDLNKNGIQDSGENILSGISAQLFKDGSTTPVKTLTSDANGSFSFTEVCDGTYILKPVLPSGWVQSSPTKSAGHLISIVNASSVIEKDFGLYQPVNTPTPFPTATPSAAPTLTPTTSPSITISFNLLLHGLGMAGDSTSPNTKANQNPLHPKRTARVEIYNSANLLVLAKQTVITYASGSGSFNGTIVAGLQGGLYTIKVKTDQYLRALFPGIQTLTVGQKKVLPSIALVVGDIDGNNILNILDYNILMGCYSDLLPAASCTDANKLLADIDDDGRVNQYDYNLFLRELQNQPGQ